jgi:hypothetical protein
MRGPGAQLTAESSRAQPVCASLNPNHGRFTATQTQS